MNDVELKAFVTQAAISEYFKKTGTLMVPVNVSNRHIHLNREAVEILFGKGYQLTVKKELSQPGQFASNEKVTTFNIRIGNYVQEYKHGQEVVLSDGDEICPTSTTIILR